MSLSELKGKPSINRRGPAAVIEDETLYATVPVKVMGRRGVG